MQLSQSFRLTPEQYRALQAKAKPDRRRSDAGPAGRMVVAKPRKGVMIKKGRDYVGELIQQIKQIGLPLPTREYVFAKPRKWRADAAYVQEKILIECEGGTFVQGRHSRGVGFQNDLIKYRAGEALGFRVIRVTPRDITSGVALALIEKALVGGWMGGKK